MKYAYLKSFMGLFQILANNYVCQQSEKNFLFHYINYLADILIKITILNLYRNI